MDTRHSADELLAMLELDGLTDRDCSSLPSALFAGEVFSLKVACGVAVALAVGAIGQGVSQIRKTTL